MFVNLGDEVPLSLGEGNLIIKAKVLAIENIKTEIRHQRFGVLEDQTEIECKPGQAAKSKLKIMTDRI